MKKVRTKVGSVQQHCLRILWIYSKGIRATDILNVIHSHPMGKHVSYKTTHTALKRLEVNGLVTCERTLLGKLWKPTNRGLMYVAKNGLIPP